MVASWLVHSSSERVVWVQALAGDIVLCSWARHFTLTVPLSTQVYKWVLANIWRKPNILQWSDLRWTSPGGLASRPGGVEILLAASCCKNQDKLQQLWAILGSKASPWKLCEDFLKYYNTKRFEIQRAQITSISFYHWHWFQIPKLLRCNNQNNCVSFSQIMPFNDKHNLTTWHNKKRGYCACTKLNFTAGLDITINILTHKQQNRNLRYMYLTLIKYLLFTDLWKSCFPSEAQATCKSKFDDKSKQF